jgi:hypothetical protein
VFLTFDEAQAKLGYNDKRFYETIMCGALQPYFISSNGKGCFPVEDARHIAKFLVVNVLSERWGFLHSDCDPEKLIIKPLLKKSQIDQRIEIILKAMVDLGIHPHGVRETKDIRLWCEKHYPVLFPEGCESSIWRKAWRKGKGLVPGEFKYWTKID